MHNITQELKSKLNNKVTNSSRLELFKDKYEGETAYIISGGPSLNNYSVDYLSSKLENELVFSIKQSWNLYKDITDFHILNFTNFEPYDWTDTKSIVLWGLFEYFHPELIQKNNIRCDMWLEVFRNNPARGGMAGPDKMKISVAEQQDFDSLLLENNDFKQPWGPGLMYEICIPWAIYLGCKKIITIGWDIGDINSFANGPEDDTQRVFQEHFYGSSDEKIVYAQTKMGPREIKSVAKSTRGMSEWLESLGIEWEMSSDRNPGWEGIPRITL